MKVDDGLLKLVSKQQTLEPRLFLNASSWIYESSSLYTVNRYR